MQTKTTTALAIAAGALITVPSPAAAQDSPLGPELAGHPDVRAQMRAAQRLTLARRVRRLELRLQRLGGDRAPGRRSLAGLASFERWQLRNRIRRLRRSIRLARREHAFTRVKIPAVLGAIARCESGGNPRAIGGGGRYRGKYQFSFATWASVGGKGDPAAASEREQDVRAAKLYARAGASPWPVCGR